MHFAFSPWALARAKAGNSMPARMAMFASCSLHAVRLQFERKFKRWEELGRKPVYDSRHEKSGRYRAPKLKKDDLDLIKAEAVFNCGGRVSQAFRKVLDANQLSPDLANYYRPGASKSYVPQKIRDAVKADVRMCEDIHHGPRQAQLNGPHIERDWSEVFAGDWHCQDDVTLPVLWYERSADGTVKLWQGQCLIDIDLRTLKVLGWVLITAKGYDSLAIRTLNTKVMEEYGLPRVGLYFERGIWEKAKLLKGDRKYADAEVLDLSYAEGGLRSLGLRFQHARLPKAKPVERVIGAIQDRIEGFPGYQGRNCTIEKFERVQKARLDVEAGRNDPEGLFLSKEEFMDELEKVIRQYNAELQDGKMLQGLSPDEAYELLQKPNDPPIRFDARCRYLLAYHRKPVTVTRKGVAIKIGKRLFRYYDEQTGQLQGRQMLAWFNPEDPSCLVLTDADASNPRTVELAPEIPAMNASEHQIRMALGRCNAHLKPAKALYRVLKAKTAQPQRRVAMDRFTADLGAEIESQRQSVETKRKENNSRASRIAKLQRELGMEGVPVEVSPEIEEALLLSRDADRKAKETGI
jgi:hypothetical protein